MTRGSSSKFLRISESGPLDEMGKKKERSSLFFFFSRQLFGRYQDVMSGFPF